MGTELKVQDTFVGSNGTPVTMYECEHLTTNTYKMENGPNLVSTGENTCVVLCVHCMTHLRGLVLAGLVTDALRLNLQEEPMPVNGNDFAGVREGVEEGVRQALAMRRIKRNA